jgi:hypothetical protein
MFHTTLKLDSDLQMFDPRKPASKNRDIYDETSYEKVDIKISKLTPMVQVVREKLLKVIVKCFLHLSGYTCKKRGAMRNYMLDMYMWLCPISYQFMIHPKQSHVPVFLDEADRLPGMEYYTVEAVFAGTEAKVKQLMRQVLEGENERVQHASTGDPDCSAGEVSAKVGQKRKQTVLNFSGGRSAGGAGVMSVMEEANVPSTPQVADNVRMDETVSEQFESYKRTVSKTLNAVNAPLSSVTGTCSVSDPDEWWNRNRTRFPLVFAV